MIVVAYTIEKVQCQDIPRTATNSQKMRKTRCCFLPVRRGKIRHSDNTNYWGIFGKNISYTTGTLAEEGKRKIVGLTSLSLEMFQMLPGPFLFYMSFQISLCCSLKNFFCSSQWFFCFQLAIHISLNTQSSLITILQLFCLREN